ncbi:hypothetical protein AB0I10_26825 [Streptomyces sp. NPDC050636]|uniref:hypothetical protein n=1 Tax=Streptomyces sp. NPDC050636 TaxID=3154510 RepID=UPI00341598E3
MSNLKAFRLSGEQATEIPGASVVLERHLQTLITYRRIKNVATVRVQPRNRMLVVNLKLDPDAVELEEGFSREIRGLGCLGIKDGVEVRIRSREDLARAGDLIRRSVEAGWPGCSRAVAPSGFR